MPNHIKINCPHCDKEIDLDNFDLSKDKFIQKYINDEINEKTKNETQRLQLQNQDTLKKAYKTQEDIIEKILQTDFLTRENDLKNQLTRYEEREKNWNTERTNLVNSLNNITNDVTKASQETYDIKYNEIKNKIEKEFSENENDLKNQLTRYEEREKNWNTEKITLVTSLNNITIDVTKASQETYDIKLKNAIKEYQLKENNLNEKIEELTKENQLLSNSKRKGNFTEQEVFQFLQDEFDSDKIERVQPGQTGADIIHEIKVNNQTSKKIYYEIKNSAKYDHKWEDKFIKDFNNSKATFGAIITKSIPKEKEASNEYIWELEQTKGIYVCTFYAYKPLCILLRKLIFDAEIASLTNQQKFSIENELFKTINSPAFKKIINKINKAILDIKNELIKFADSNTKHHVNLLTHIKTVEFSFNSLISNFNFDFGSDTKEDKTIKDKQIVS